MSFTMAFTTAYLPRLFRRSELGRTLSRFCTVNLRGDGLSCPTFGLEGNNLVSPPARGALAAPLPYYLPLPYAPALACRLAWLPLARLAGAGGPVAVASPLGCACLGLGLELRGARLDPTCKKRLLCGY
jgi:hypothetical protein